MKGWGSRLDYFVAIILLLVVWLFGGGRGEWQRELALFFICVLRL